MAIAYDYGSQRWLEGAEAAAEAERQRQEELAILRSSRGAEYLRFIGSKLTVEQAIARIETKD